jgi:hypothetical protein
MNEGDYMFGISPSGAIPRRVVFAAKVASKMTFARAYKEYPRLRGKAGPIHVRPVHRPELAFPESDYEHIADAQHSKSWCADIATPNLDAFFAFERGEKCVGRWLGPAGPPVTGEILDFMRTCQVYGKCGFLSQINRGATETYPVRHGNLFTGLHLETNNPKRLVKLVCRWIDDIPAPEPPVNQSRLKSVNCGKRRKAGAC